MSKGLAALSKADIVDRITNLTEGGPDGWDVFTGAQSTVVLISAQGAMYLMPDIRATGLGGEGFANALPGTNNSRQPWKQCVRLLPAL